MNERNVLSRVGCEGGTYIRKLCYDIGENFRCSVRICRSYAGAVQDLLARIVQHALLYMM